MKKRVVSVLCVAMLMSVITIPGMGAEATEDAQDDSAIDSDEQQSGEEETSESPVIFDGPFEITDDAGRQVIGCEVSNASEVAVYVGITVEFFDASGEDIGVNTAYVPCIASGEKAFIYVTNFYGEDYAEYSFQMAEGTSDYLPAVTELGDLDVSENGDNLTCTAENSSAETILLPQVTFVYTVDSEPMAVSTGILRADGSTDLCLESGQTGTADIACPGEYDEYEYYVAAMIEGTAEDNTLSSEEYIDMVHTFAYQVMSQMNVLSTLGGYMSNDLAMRRSQEECLENGLNQLEENDGVDQTYITVGVNTIYALCQQLTPPPDEYLDLYNDILVPLDDCYVDFYNLIMINAGNYESMDDLFDATDEITDKYNEAIEAYTDYFSIDEETVTVGPDADATKALDEYIANGYEYPSRGDFVDQLVYIEGYPEEVAEATVEAYDYDWNSLAVEDLLVLLEDFGANSPRDLRSWMEGDGFTEDEIEYALENAEVDWNELAVQDANFWNDYGDGRDRDNIIQNLLLDGFTQEQAEYGAAAVGY